MGARETPIQSAILELLQWKGVFAWRCQAIPVPIRRGNQIVGLRAANEETLGIPDILGCHKGRLFGIEVKSAKGVLSDGQKRWRDNILKAGGAWTCARSTEEAEQFLKETFGV